MSKTEFFFKQNYSIESDDWLSDVPEDVLNKLESLSRSTNRFERISDPQYRFEEAINDSEKAAYPKKTFQYSATPMERSLPAHAGAILADLRFGFHDVGIKIANHDSLVLTTAHIYRALRAMGILKDDWPDMEYILSSAFNKKQSLVAKVGCAYDGETAANCYLLALGIPLTAFARYSRRAGTVKVKDARKLIINSPFLQKMSDREGCWKKRGFCHSKSRSIEVVLQTLTTSETIKSGVRESFTPVKLLSTFKKTILSNELSLNFDHISFMFDCADLLKSVGEKAGIKCWTQCKCGKAIDSDCGGQILMTLHLLRSPHQSAKIKEVVSLFSRHISNSGKNYIQSASDQSSGRIPKNLRPKIEARQTRLKNNDELFCTILDYANTVRDISSIHLQIALTSPRDS